MKKIFTLILGLGMVASANAQMASNVQARVYAYDLQQEETTVPFWDITLPAYKLTFKTNTAATSATITLSAEGQNDVVVNATATDNTNKTWEAVVSGATAGMVEADYNWKVEVSAPAVTSFQPIYDTASKNFFVYRSFGLCVDKSPESDNFGRIYLASQYAFTGTFTTTRTRHTSFGMYTYAADLNPENNANAYACDIMTTETTAGTRPADMCISEDGRLFVAVTEGDKYGVHYINPSDFKTTNVFPNTTVKTESYGDSKTALFNTDGTRLTGVGGALTTFGAKENTQLVVLDSDVYRGAWTRPLSHFAIGEENQWTETVATTALGPAGARMVYTYPEDGNKNIHVNRGHASMDATKNGIWVVQTNNTLISGKGSTLTAVNDLNHPTLFYYSRIANKVTYVDNTFISNVSPALAVNEDLGLMACTPNGTANPIVKKYTENEETGAIEILQTETAYDLKSQLGSKADALDFDYAGNLYAVTSGNEKFRIYALPDAIVGENTRVTPAKSSLVVSIDGDTMDEVTAIEGVNADANAPVEYYNLQGVKVENPAGGIFIKKQGGKTTKVVL